MKLNAILIIIFSFSYSITPPISGDFPIGFWENMRLNSVGEQYGDPGWIRKIATQRNNPSRDIQNEFNLPVLLGQYSDVTSVFFNAADFDELLFGDNPTGSMKEYYNEISYGNFLLDGTVNGWYQSGLSQAEAVANTRQYVAEIASLADSEIDYGQYDNDGPDNIPNSGDDDGFVDGLAVIYPGCLSGNENIWAHQSSLGSNYQYVTNDLAPNGQNIIINSYMVCPELPGSVNCITDNICPMGVYAHEFGHILGLPDLYDRDSNDGDSEGLGEWCLMASGSWLGWYGDTPSHMSSWCKIEMGWMEPTIAVNTLINTPVPQLATSPSVIKVWEDNYRLNRYFLVENRQNYGFDSDLNGAGLLIYHVNENRIAGFNSFGPVNDDENDKLVDLEEADGLQNLDNEINRGDQGDPFPGSSGNISFTGESNPSSNRNDGTPTGISIQNISDADSIMYADITPRAISGYSIFYDEYGIAPTSLSIGTEEQWSGVLFTSESEGYLTEIDFGIVWEVFWNTDILNWEVYVYESFDFDTPGNLYETVSGSSNLGGWHTIQIDSMYVNSGQEFFIGIKFLNNGYVYAFDNIGDLSGRSYLSSDGIYYENLLSSYGDANIRAKITTDTFVKNVSEIIPNEQVVLYPNYPNPFNPTTNLSFSLERDDKILLEVYDMAGRYMNTIMEGFLPYGKHSIPWDGSSFSSGVYFVKLQTNDIQINQKIILLK